jgi:hypothetical protein
LPCRVVDTFFRIANLVADFTPDPDCQFSGDFTLVVEVVVKRSFRQVRSFGDFIYRYMLEALLCDKRFRR